MTRSYENCRLVGRSRWSKCLDSTRAFAVLALMLILLGPAGGCPQDPNTLDPASQQNLPQDAPPTDDNRDPADAPGADDLAKPRLLEGPGFSLTIPPGFKSAEDQPPYPSYSFWRFYTHEFDDVSIAVGVLDAASTGTSTVAENYSMRIKGAVLTATDDFLLNCRMRTDEFYRDEAEGAVGLLADGKSLVLVVGSPYFDGGDELTAQMVFQSVNLAGTNGRDLEKRWRDAAPRIRVKADNDLLVLSDGSVWQLTSTATFGAKSEFNSWRRGDSIIPQMVNDYFRSHEELVHVGNWHPIAVDYLDFAAETEIVNILDAWKVQLSDGITYHFGAGVPAGWKVGDMVFTVADGALSTWLIHERTGNAARFY